MEFIQNLAKKHKLRIMIRDLSDGPRAYLMDNVVYLDESLSPERRNFAFCHELAHRLLNHQLKETLSEEMEREANSLAAELLLPPDTFRMDAVIYRLDQLKELYPQASWEVIARSRLMVVPAIMTIFDNGKQTVRLAPDDFQFPYHLMPVEMEVYSYCMKNREHYILRKDSILISGYVVDSGEGVLRIILWTEIDE